MVPLAVVDTLCLAKLALYLWQDTRYTALYLSATHYALRKAHKSCRDHSLKGAPCVCGTLCLAIDTTFLSGLLDKCPPCVVDTQCWAKGTKMLSAQLADL